MVLNKRKQISPIMARIWDDSRVPIFARVFLLMVPNYLYFPCDQRPEYLQAGFTDEQRQFFIKNR